MSESEADKKQSDEEFLRIQSLKARAVRQAMTEIMREHQDEIIKRAVAKLVAQGVAVEDADVEPQIS